MAIDYTRLTQDASAVEILEAVSKLKSKKEKISLLQRYGDRSDFMADIYLNIIRSLHIDEAKLVMSIVGKKLPYKGITQALVAEAFPKVWPKEEKKTA